MVLHSTQQQMLLRYEASLIIENEGAVVLLTSVGEVHFPLVALRHAVQSCFDSFYYLCHCEYLLFIARLCQ